MAFRIVSCSSTCKCYGSKSFCDCTEGSVSSALIVSSASQFTTIFYFSFFLKLVISLVIPEDIFIQEFFGAGEVFCDRGISINISCTTYKRKAPQGKCLVSFLQDTLKTAL